MQNIIMDSSAVGFEDDVVLGRLAAKHGLRTHQRSDLNRTIQ